MPGCPTTTRMARATGAILRESRSASIASRTTDGDGYADRSRVIVEGFNTDPTNDVAGGLLHHNGDLFLGAAPALWRLRDANGDGLIDSRAVVSQGYNVHPAFGGHGISGVTLGPDGRVYWEVGDMGFDVVDQSGRRWSFPNQGAVLRANPDGSDFEVFATGIRNLQEFAFDEYGQSHQRGQRRRPRRRDRARRLSDGRLRQRLARQLAVRQVHRPRQQSLQPLDGRGDVPAPLRGTARAHHAADRAVPCRSGRDGLRPWNRVVRRVAPSFLRRQFSRVRRQRPHPRVPADEGRRRFRARERQGPAAGHPDRRHEVRSGRSAVSGRLDQGLGVERTRDGSGRWIRPRRP